MSDENTVSRRKEGPVAKPTSWRAQAVQLAAIVAVVFVGFVSLSTRNPYAGNAGDALLRTLSLFLVFAPGVSSNNPSAERAPWGALLAGGLLLAAVGLGWFAGWALAPDGRIEWRRGRWGLLTFVLGAALWAAAAFHG